MPTGVELWRASQVGPSARRTAMASAVGVVAARALGCRRGRYSSEGELEEGGDGGGVSGEARRIWSIVYCKFQIADCKLLK